MVLKAYFEHSLNISFLIKSEEEMYVNRLEKEILSLDKKKSCSNLEKREKNTLYLLCDDPSIIIKEVTKDQPY